MHHHDPRNYGQAVNDAQQHLEREITARSRRALEVMQRVQDEVPTDHIVPLNKFAFATDPTDGHVRLKSQGGSKPGLPLHRNALQQACTMLGMPKTFLTNLQEHISAPGKTEGADLAEVARRESVRKRAAGLITHNLNELVQMSEPKRVLVRRVKNDVRSLVSDSYLRMSGPQLIDAFAKVCKEVGAVLLEGTAGDLRFSLKAVIGKVMRVGPTGREEIITWGGALSNSDHGCGALSLQLFVLRVWCTNTARTEDTLRKVHLGRKLEDDIVLREDTIRAETVATCKLLRDNMHAMLAPARIRELTGMVDQAMEHEIDPKKVYEDLAKRGLTKATVKQVQSTFEDESLGIHVLPQGRDAWRMSNALSWLAQSAGVMSAEDRMNLEDEAGRILSRKW